MTAAGHKQRPRPAPSPSLCPHHLNRSLVSCLSEGVHPSALQPEPHADFPVDPCKGGGASDAKSGKGARNQEPTERATDQEQGRTGESSRGSGRLTGGRRFGIFETARTCSFLRVRSQPGLSNRRAPARADAKPGRGVPDFARMRGRGCGDHDGLRAQSGLWFSQRERAMQKARCDFCLFELWATARPFALPRLTSK